MGSRLTIKPPRDYELRRDVRSYGYYVLAPNRWDDARGVLERVLELEDGVVTVRVAQPEGAGGTLRAACDRGLSRRESNEAKRQIERMLRVHEDVSVFHAVDPRWKRGGRGRLFRSPTFFEDVVKTITSCNVTWAGTTNMNRRLCDVVNPAFPRATQLARTRPAKLRTRCGVGYRDVRIVELAKLFASGAVSEAMYADASLSDDEVYRMLLKLPGVGPYAASNVLQLLGRYSRLAMDTEMVRHGRERLGMTGTSREVEKQLEAHYAPFGDQKFRSYWFEMWEGL